MKNIIVIISAFLFLVGGVQAAAPTGLVNKTFPWSTALLVQLENDNDYNPAGCSNAGFYYALVNFVSSNPNQAESVKELNKNNQINLALARSAEKPVTLSISKTECFGGIPVINSVIY